MARDRLQILFVKTHRADLHPPVGLYQENRRNVGQAIDVRDGITAIIEDHRESDVVLGCKAFRGALLVLGNAKKGCAARAVPLMEALQKRKCELTDGAGDLEERSDDWAAVEQRAKRILLLV